MVSERGYCYTKVSHGYCGSRLTEKRTINDIEMGLDILEDGAIKTIEGIQILKKGLNKFAKMCKDKDV